MWLSSEWISLIIQKRRSKQEAELKKAITFCYAVSISSKDALFKKKKKRTKLLKSTVFKKEKVERVKVMKQSLSIGHPKLSRKPFFFSFQGNRQKAPEVHSCDCKP